MKIPASLEQPVSCLVMVLDFPFKAWVEIKHLLEVVYRVGIDILAHRLDHFQASLVELPGPIFLLQQGVFCAECVKHGIDHSIKPCPDNTRSNAKLLFLETLSLVHNGPSYARISWMTLPSTSVRRMSRPLKR